MRNAEIGVRSMKILFHLSVGATLLLIAVSSFATEKSWVATPAPDGSTGLNFSIGYSLGVHNGSAKTVIGSVKLQDNPLMISSAEFTIPVLSLSTFNEERDCHLLEALALDYTVSDFPASHACNHQNQLPGSGPNSIAYPNIKFSFTSLIDANSTNALAPNVPKDLLAAGTLEMHGIKKNVQIPLTLTLNSATPQTINVKGAFDILLSEYGAIVKKFLFIKTKDTVTIGINFNLEEKAESNK